MRTMTEVINESTCQKRITVTEIYDINGVLLSRESNRCNPSGGKCHRIGVVQCKSDYSVDSNCNWVHSEINAINALPKDCNPYMAICYGHIFFCDACEKSLRNVGVEFFKTEELNEPYTRSCP